MLYIYYGNNREKLISQSNQLIYSLRNKKPEALFYEFWSDNFDIEKIKELAKSQTLFNQSYVVQIRFLSENKPAMAILAELFFELAKSANIFILVEEKLLIAEKKLAEKYAQKIINCGFSKEARAFKGAREAKINNPFFADYNIYNLTEAFGARNTKKFWVEYNKAVMAGFPIEEIFWKINWQLRIMLILDSLGKGEEPDLNPYVENKSRRYLKNYSREELLELSRRLIKIYHGSHRGLNDLDVSLERFVLDLEWRQ